MTNGAKVLKVPKVLVVVVTLAVSFAAPAAQAPAPSTANGVITGQVVDAATGKPVSAAIVSVSGPGVSMRATPSSGPQPSVPRILTGADGRFMFRDLGAGTFTIAATKNGYSDAPTGRRGGQAVTLTGPSRTADAVVRLWKNAVIAGTVVDEAGEAVAGIQVRALARAMSGGRVRYASSTAVATTDDRGVYRFSNLLPGDYLVVASAPVVGARLSAFEDVARTGRGSGELGLALERLGSIASSGAIQVGDAVVVTGRATVMPPQPRPRSIYVYPPTFHPSTQSPRQASAVSVAPGEERTGVDVQLQPTPTVRVSGSLVSPGDPASMASLRLVPAGGDEFAIEGFAPVTGADASGAFTFPAVVPGQYTLRASTRSGAEVHWVDMPISVPDTDLDGVAAVLRAGLSISGRVEFEGAAPRPERAQIPVRLELADGTPGTFPPAAPVNTASPSFALKGYAAGKYLVQVTASPPGWMFKSAMLNGVDVSEAPFDFRADAADLVITFTDRWTGIGGAVQGAPLDRAMVVVFPVDAQRWVDYGSTPRRLKSQRPTAQGAFGISSLPPGDYYAIAINEEQAGEWRDPGMLETLARIATRVSLGDGEYRTIDLTLRGVKR